MERLDALHDLLAKVKAGGDVYDFGVVGGPTLRGYAEGACVGSLDAAKKLHEAVLPGWSYMVGVKGAAVSVPDAHDGSIGVVAGQTGFSGVSDGSARAWLIAILEALIALEEEKE